MIKSYCKKEKCSYRKLVGERKAFCVLPRCIFDERENLIKVKKLNENLLAKDILKRR